MQKGLTWAGMAMALTFTTAAAGCSSGGANGGSGGTVGSGGGVGSGGRIGSGGSVAGGAGAGGAITTLNGSRSLGSLSPAEATQLCNDTYAYYSRAISQATLCKEAGLAFGVSSSAPTDAQLEQNCQSQGRGLPVGRSGCSNLQHHSQVLLDAGDPVRGLHIRPGRGFQFRGRRARELASVKPAICSPCGLWWPATRRRAARP